MLKNSLARGQALVQKTVLSLKENGIKQTVAKMIHKLRPGSSRAASWTYDQWVACFGCVNTTDIQQMKDSLSSFRWRPKISVLMPLYRCDPISAVSSLKTILDQVYPDIEICISASREDQRKIEKMLQADGYACSRLCWVAEGNCQQEAFHKAFSAASGDYSVSVKDADRLPPEATWVICHQINACHGNADILYGDEDRLDKEGHRQDPWFKPDWDRSLLAAGKNLGRCIIYRTKLLSTAPLVEQSGCNWEDSLLMDVLGNTEDSKIIHIPHILCHCEGSSKSAEGARKQMDTNHRGRHACRELPSEVFSRYGKPWRSWVEFVCPFHRGDVLLGLQVAYTAAQKGIRVRMHISRDLIHWLDDFAYGDSIALEAIDIGIPKAEMTAAYFAEAVQKVSSREDFSGYLVCSHPTRSLDELGMNLAENMLAQFGLPLDTQLCTVKVKEISEDRTKELAAKLSVSMKQTVLLHPNGGWRLKCMSPENIIETVEAIHAMDYQVLQIGGPSDMVAEGVDGYLLENLSLKDWAYLFQNSCALVGVDSWTAHFASIVHANQCIVYGSTAHKDVCSKPHFADQSGKCLIMPSDCEYVPCNSVSCRYGCQYCKGMTIRTNTIHSLLLPEKE